MNMQDQENWHMHEKQRSEWENDSKKGSGAIGFIVLLGFLIGIVQLFLYMAK